MRALHSRRFFAAVVFVAATLVLAVQLINPSPVVVSVGESGTKVTELGGYFRYRDVGLIAVASAVLGATGTYLLSDSRPGIEESPDRATTGERDPTPTPDDPAPSDELLEARRREWAETADRLVDNEQAIYETVMEADGVVGQKEIVERTDLSKATVSRVLDGLETKNLVERKRRGMGNMVLLL